jgi:hypothetical protein
MSAQKTFIQKFVELQNRVKVTKDQFNSFGKYSYWTVGDILADARPIANELGLAIIMTDEIVEIHGRFYVKAQAIITDGESKLHGQALAREAHEKKGMDEAQITGSSSSYARKYCLAGLLGLDGEKDSDSTNTHQDAPNKPQNQPQSNPQRSQPSSQGDGPKPSAKQLSYIKMLAEKAGVPMPTILSIADADKAIKDLTARTR